MLLSILFIICGVVMGVNMLFSVPVMCDKKKSLALVNVARVVTIISVLFYFTVFFLVRMKYDTLSYVNYDAISNCTAVSSPIEYKQTEEDGSTKYLANFNIGLLDYSVETTKEVFEEKPHDGYYFDCYLKTNTILTKFTEHAEFFTTDNDYDTSDLISSLEDSYADSQKLTKLAIEILCFGCSTVFSALTIASFMFLKSEKDKVDD